MKMLRGVFISLLLALVTIAFIYVFDIFVSSINNNVKPYVWSVFQLYNVTTAVTTSVVTDVLYSATYTTYITNIYTTYYVETNVFSSQAPNYSTVLGVLLIILILAPMVIYFIHMRRR